MIFHQMALVRFVIYLKNSVSNCYRQKSKSVSYRNDTAALTFIQHVGTVLHNDLVKKIKKSPVPGKCFQSNILLITIIICSCLHRLDDG